MPSGSRGSGGHSGGGHSGGFSSRGGHSSHSSHSSYGNRHSYGSRFGHRGMRGGRSVNFYYFGGRRFYSSSVVSGLVPILFVISIFAIIFGLVVRYENQDEINDIKEDYAMYQTYINQMERGNKNYLLVEDAKIDSIRRCDNIDGYYCIEYHFYTNDGRNRSIDGHTFCTYTDELLDRYGYVVGGNIELVVNCYNGKIRGDEDSIDYNYKFTKLEDDADYQYELSKIPMEKRLSNIIFIGAGVMAGIAVLLIVFGVKKDKGRIDKSSASVSNKSTYEDPFYDENRY